MPTLYICLMREGYDYEKIEEKKKVRVFLHGPPFYFAANVLGKYVVGSTGLFPFNTSK